jgi:hypothetical protein
MQGVWTYIYNNGEQDSVAMPLNTARDSFSGGLHEDPDAHPFVAESLTALWLVTQKQIPDGTLHPKICGHESWGMK